MQVCGYCGEPKGEKFGCCGECHWEEVDDNNIKRIARKHPKEIAQAAFDNGYVPTFLPALCALIMCSDPTPLSKEQDKDLKNKADYMARQLGFSDWVEAYHGLN